MTNSRRIFLRDLSRSAFAAAFVLASSRAGLGQTSSNVPAQAPDDPVLLFTAATFALYVGDIFRAPNSRGENVELRLDQVKKYEAKNGLTSKAQPTDSFTLLFKASAQLPPLTSIHEISHPRLGKFDLFLTLHKNDKGELFYEAVINHLQ
jgi:hypothetical protein